MFKLTPERQQLFDIVEAATISSPRIYELNRLHLPKNNHIIVLDFSHQPGCHYRGVFVKLIKHLEENGIKIDGETYLVTPETAILAEASTGNAYEDFAIAANLLGYKDKVKVVMPDGLPEARYSPAKKYGVKIIKTPAQNYAIGMRDGLVRMLKTNSDRVSKGKLFSASPNHSGKDTGEITTTHMGKMIDQLVEVYDEVIDFAVFGLGNGSSITGPGRRLIEESASDIYAVEPFATGLAYDMWRPGEYKETFDIEPANKDLLKNFRIYGLNAPVCKDTSQQGKILPLQTKAIKEVVDRIILVNDAEVNSRFKKLKPSSMAKRNADGLVMWDKTQERLINEGYNFGRSSAACIGAALQEFSLKNLRYTNALCIVYDDTSKY